MKQNLLVFIFFLTVSGLSAQLSVEVQAENDVFLYNVSAGDEQKIGMKVTNNGSENAEWFWEVEKADDFPDHLKVQVCDTQGCYVYDGLKCLEANLLGPGASSSYKETYVNVVSFGEAGSSHVILKIYDNDKFENPVYVSKPFTSSSTEIEQDLSINVYPNPTTGELRISEDEAVTKVSIFNIVGKEMLTLNHTRGAHHDISFLKNGMYIVRLFDEKGKVVKTSRLSKR